MTASVLKVEGRRVAFRAAVFDLFHTLVDPQEHAPPGFRRLASLAEILDVPIGDIDLWWQQVVDELVTSPVSPVDAVVDFARSRRIVLSPLAVAEVDRALGAHADRALQQPVDGVEEALRRLGGSGVAIGVLSNAIVRDVRAFPDSPLAALVDDACMSCFTGNAKPQPRAYEEALERLGVTAADAVFVGDGGSDEFEGARQVGFGAVVAVTGPVRRGGWRATAEQDRLEARADVRVKDVADLIDLIED